MASFKQGIGLQSADYDFQTDAVINLSPDLTGLKTHAHRTLADMRIATKQAEFIIMCATVPIKDVSAFTL
ncbi:MAG: hypothetical protein ACYC9K_12970 [Sulfuricaulis sp.]